MKRRHHSSERFHQILKEIGDLHDMKQADYGSDNDPFANVRAAEDFGLPGWVGGAIRMNDKMRRITKAGRLGPESLKFDSVEDDLRDMACYAVICLVMLEEMK
jgi:hypothetical protein